MATWYVDETETGKGIVYVNNEGKVATCGCVAKETTNAGIVVWILLEGSANVGDVIRFPDGAVNQIQGRIVE